jgi:hypothetical protein
MRATLRVPQNFFHVLLTSYSWGKIDVFIVNHFPVRIMYYQQLLATAERDVVVIGTCNNTMLSPEAKALSSEKSRASENHRSCRCGTSADEAQYRRGV